MSDIDDLLKLQQLLDSGAITKKEFEREKAWILEGRAENRKAAGRKQEGTYTGRISETAGNSRSSTNQTTGRGTQTSRRAETGRTGGAQVTGSVQQRSTGGWSADRQKDGQDDCPRWMKNLIIGLSIFITWPAAFVLILLKKPFSKRVNIILAMWNGIASVILVASLARTVTLVQVQRSLQTGEAAATVTSQLADAGDASYEQFLEELESTLQSSYGDRYSISDNGTTLTVSIWQDGVADEASYVLEGNEQSAEAWDNLKKSLENLSLTCFTEANSVAPERHVVLNVLNDQNTENVLLSYLDGSCVYDVVASTQSSSASTESAGN